MEHLNLLLNHRKSNEIEFDVTVEGLAASNDMLVRFLIETVDFSMGFDCKHHTGSKWSVVLPALPHLEKETYPFKIEAIVDGYYFIPVKGTINVVGSAEVYISKPENLTFKSPTTQEKPKEEPKDTVGNVMGYKEVEHDESVTTKSENIIKETKKDSLNLKSIFGRDENVTRKKEESKTSRVDKDIDQKVKNVLKQLQRSRS
jgi:hypothetical protein